VPNPQKLLERDAAKLDKQRAKSEAYTHQIIESQESLIKAAKEGIRKVNSDLRALRVRLRSYTGKRPKPRDAAYEDLKHRYEYKLGERETLQNAQSMAEESITAAKLHHIPGEDTREGD
jgi:hypothetical protein